MNDNLPEHIAIIMDGNGRWAAQRGLPRTEGHRAGARTVNSVIEACAKKGIGYLTLYSFSTENWKRDSFEVRSLMKLIEWGFKSNIKNLVDNDLRFNAIGALEKLPGSLRETISSIKDITASNNGMMVNFALNYGARDEILSASRALARKCVEGIVRPEDLSEEDFSDELYTSRMPDPELVIRTSGEFRISNFLLWQSAYSEFYITDTLWPDFTKEELGKAIDSYSKRERRFGE